MEEQLHQQLLRLSDEAAATAASLDARIEAAVANMEAAKACGDDMGLGLYKEIYGNLVAKEKDNNALRRAALEAQLAGRRAP